MTTHRIDALLDELLRVYGELAVLRRELAELRAASIAPPKPTPTPVVPMAPSRRGLFRPRT
ncbi:hypothetical protein MXD61_06890 [Frankia sp. AgPm24]|uniref:hypothetical protein n=1 Tax=Frankia sp. AgPm24 TaxID=631128 RepID=UPI00200F3B2A|nr:hypothetical protein [Frankia sp. AgPm24]MCK9921617.1 hypothetical protein [Frankia sp. AgPm24]